MGRLLEDAGFAFEAPDLPGAGERYHGERPTIGLDDYLSDLEAQFIDLDLEDVTLVGHSQGGFVARALSQRVASRLRTLAYLDAPVPANGERAVDFGPGGDLPPPSTWLDPVPVVAGEYVSADDAALINERLTPQPAGVALDPVVLTSAAALALPQAHAFCQFTPPGFPCELTRVQLDESGQGYEVLPAGHDAPVTHPEVVAEWLLNLAD